MDRMNRAKELAEKDGRLKWDVNIISERLNKKDYIKWSITEIKGSKVMEEEEYNDSLEVFKQVNNAYRKELTYEQELNKVGILVKIEWIQDFKTRGKK